MYAKHTGYDFRRHHPAAEQPRGQFHDQRMVLQQHHEFQYEGTFLFRVRIKPRHHLEQRFVVGDPFYTQNLLAGPVIPRGEDDPAAVMLKEDQKTFFNGAHVEVVDNQQRIFFQRPQKAVMPEEARFICIGGKIIRKIHVGYIPPQITGIHDVDAVRVFLFMFSGISFCDFAFPDPRHAFQEKNMVADQRFMQLLQFLIPSAEMRAGRWNLIA